MILKRIQIREEIKVASACIIKFIYKIHLLRKRSINLPNPYTYKQSLEYYDLLRKLKSVRLHRIELIQDLQNDNFKSPEENISDVSERIEDDIKTLKFSLQKIRDYKLKIACQIEEQKKFMKKIDLTIDIGEQSKSDIAIRLLSNKLD